jgi:hypothetical protein
VLVVQYLLGQKEPMSSVAEKDESAHLEEVTFHWGPFIFYRLDQSQLHYTLNKFGRTYRFSDGAGSIVLLEREQHQNLRRKQCHNKNPYLGHIMSPPCGLVFPNVWVSGVPSAQQNGGEAGYDDLGR